jgi:hypothetical protein
MRNPFGIPSRREREYAKPERLADVMAMIQVLALDEHSHRSEAGLAEELQGPPQSARAWTEVGRAHPEFFRVRTKGTHVVSLVSRHVTKRGDDGIRELSPDFVAGLLRSAIDIHDRQVRRAERWTYLTPIWVALMAGLFTLGAALIELFKDS